MKCEQAEALMAGLLLDGISPEDRRAVEEHLLECANCRADFEQARRGGLVEWPDRPVPPPLAEAVLAAIRRPSPLLKFLRAATAAAAALCVALLAAVAARRPAVPETPEAGSFAAMMVPTGLGSLVARDEEGRPVGELGLRSHTVEVEILDGIARTTVEENFENHTDRRLEGTFHFPLPPDASISRLALEVNGKIEEGTCLERERAREVFESIVRKMQDPALLEWMPGGIFKCRVFPIEPRSTKRVIVAYTQALPFFRGRMSYVYPLASEKTRTHPPGEVRIEVRTRFSGKLTKIESPSHPVDVQRRDEHEARASFSARNYRPEEDFVLSMETEDEELRVVAHKTDGEDGYFVLFLTPRGEPERQPRKYVFILDISASVSGPELDVAKRVVRVMMGRGIPGDRFEILAHNVGIERSGEVDVRGADEFLGRLKPVGGCDLLAALRAAPEGEIIYIGEGTPTIGEADPAMILGAVKGRRVRTVAVGSDANVTLLERMGGHFRINPNDHVARRVEEIASTMGCEAIRDVRVEGGDSIYDVVGVRDLFFGERLAVVGRYRGPAETLGITAGVYRREVKASLPLREEGNNYVRRLWAQRKAAELLARGGSKDEVTALGVKYQIMTPYTSFLVLENEEMWKQFNLKREAQSVDELLGKHKMKFEEFASKRLDEAMGKGQKELAIEAAALQKMARAKGGEEGRRVVELADKYNNIAMSQFGGRMKYIPKVSPQEVEKQLRQYRDGEDKPAPASPAVPPPPGGDWVSILPPEPSPTPGTTGVGRHTGSLVRHQDMLREMEETYARGMRALERGEREAATREFRTVLDVDKGMPTGVDRGNFRSRVLDAIGDLERSSSGQDGVRLGLYDARDLIPGIQDFSGPRMELVSAGGSGGGGPLTGATFTLEGPEPGFMSGDQLIELVKANVTPGTWREGQLIRTPNGQLLVEAPPSVQHEVSEFLKKLRGEAGSLNQMGIRADVAPGGKVIVGKVTEVANEIGLVVISVGTEDGVREGDQFTVYRGRDFVSKIVIEKVDHKWAAGKVVLKKVEPRQEDAVSNRAPVPVPLEIPVVGTGRTTEELVLGGGSKDGLWRGQFLIIVRGGKFIAIVILVDVSPDRSTAIVWRGMSMGAVLAGDRAESVSDMAGYIAALPDGVRLDLASRSNLLDIRAKMGRKP